MPSDTKKKNEHVNKDADDSPPVIDGNALEDAAPSDAKKAGKSKVGWKHVARLTSLSAQTSMVTVA